MIAKKISDFIDLMSNRTDIIIIQDNQGHPLPKSKVDENLPISDELKEFYKEMDGCSFEWTFVENKIYSAALNITAYNEIKFEKANDLYVGDLQKKYETKHFALIDTQHSECLVYYCKETGEMLHDNRTSKDGMLLVAKSFNEYIEKGIKYGFSAHWMENSTEAKETKKRLDKIPKKTKKIVVGSRITVVSKMYADALHGNGEVIKIKSKIYLVLLDYGAKFWFYRQEIELANPKTNYEKAFNNNNLLQGVIDKAKNDLKGAVYSILNEEEYCHTPDFDRNIKRFYLTQGAYGFAGIINSLDTQKKLELTVKLLHDNYQNGKAAHSLLDSIYLICNRAIIEGAENSFEKLFYPETRNSLQEFIATFNRHDFKDEDYFKALRNSLTFVRKMNEAGEIIVSLSPFGRKDPKNYYGDLDDFMFNT